MFPVEFDWLIFIYLGSFIVSVTILWLVAERKREQRNFVAGEHNQWSCYICGQIFINSRQLDMVTCPRCGAINARTDSKNPDIYT